jgi:hypothetical protein
MGSSIGSEKECFPDIGHYYNLDFSYSYPF